jgi:hypothetical protein
MADQSFLDQVVNPIQNAFTSLTKGSDLSGLPYSAQEAALARRQKLAELLMQQGQQQPEVLTYKGIAAQPSVAGGLGKALSQFMGAYMGGKAEEDLATAKAKEAKDVSDIFAGLADRPDVKTKGYYLPTEQPSKTMPIGMPRGASSFMPEGEATNMGTYVPGTVTPGQHLSDEEKTNRIMAGMATHPSMATLAPMYLQNMRNKVEDTRYASEQKKSDTRFEASQAQIDLENKRNAANDKWKQAEALRDDARALQAHQDAVTASRDAAAATLAYRQSIRDNKPEFNQQQGQAATFADRMFNADRTLRDAGVIAAAQSRIQAGLGSPKVPFSNSLVSGDKQALEQAKKDFLTAQLRQESGAAISDSEFVRGDQQYFPQPGDSKATIDMKAKNRSELISGMRRQAGRNYVPPTIEELYPTGKNTTPTSSTDPDAAELAERRKKKVGG